MFDAMKAIFAKKESAEKPPLSDVAWSETFLAWGKQEKYNPDDLVGQKGYAIYSKMMQDEQVKAVVRFRRDAITGRGWQFVYDGDTLSPEEAAKRIELYNAIVRKMPGSFTDAMNGIMSAVFNGMSLSEKVFMPIDHRGKAWMGIRKVQVKPYNTFCFRVDEYGNTTTLVQKSGQKEQELDPRRFIHYVQNPDEDSQYGQSELRAAYRAWFAKEITIKLANIHLERHASGFLHISPPQGTVLKSGTAEFTALQAMLENINAKTAMLLPAGFTVTHTQPTQTTAYVDMLAVHDKAIAKALLVPNLLGITEQGQTGSYSQSQTQFEAFMLTLEADAGRLEECLNEQLFRHLGDLNWGDGEYPEFRFLPTNETDKQAMLTLWRDLTTANVVSKGANDEDFIREQLEMPAYEQPEEEEPAPGEQPPVPSDEEPAPDGEGEPPTEIGEPAPDEEPVDAGELPEEDEKGKKPKMTADERRAYAFAQAMARVDFAVIDNSSRDIENRYSKEVADAMQALVTRTMDDAALESESIDKLTVPVGEKDRMRRALKRMLKDAWGLGEKHARKEVATATKMAAPDSLGDLAAKWLDAKAFTIAGSLTDRILGQIKQTLLTGIKNSLPLDEVKTNIEAQLNEAGLFVDTHQLDTVIRTNTFEAINEARYDYFKDPALGDFVQAFEYSAIMDDRTTEICRHLDGKTYAADSDVWSMYRPPNHYNCRSLLIAVTAGDQWQESPAPSIKPQGGFK